MTAPIERIPFGPEPPPRAVRKRIVQTLSRGDLIALPTETVYGIAARADRSESVERLRAIKRRPNSMGFTWHVADASALDLFPQVSMLARRLAAKYWPGPLTLVLPGVPKGLEAAATGGWTGLRVPAFVATRKLIEELDFPLIATSANRHGQIPLHDAAQIAREFEGEVALVLDGGVPPLKEGSVVLKVGPGSFELLRAGIIGLDQLRRTAGLRIGFVCTGNTCRSPMAEALARDLVAKRLEVSRERVGEFGFDFRSMGISAANGAPAAANAIELLAAEDIDLSEHRSRTFEPELIDDFDRVYALTNSHLEALRAMLPSSRAKQCQLLDTLGRDIADPVGGPLEEYRMCAAEIRAAVQARSLEWV